MIDNLSEINNCIVNNVRKLCESFIYCELYI